MKLTFRDIEPFIKNPNPAARVILIYGPDDGLMRERCRLIAQKITPDLNDPFNVSSFQASDLSDAPGKLADEAHAMSMMGGARVVFIYDAGDKTATAALKSYLDKPSEDNLVIVQAGDLSPRSSLRMLCEKAKNAAALPCYVQDGQDLSRLISGLLEAEGVRADYDALNYLTANLVGDYAQVKSEMEKLVTYIGPGKKQVSLDDAMNNTGSLSEQKLEELVYACAGGNTIAATSLLSGILAEGGSGVMVVRGLQNHFRRLLIVHMLCQQGQAQQAAMKSLQPQVFFKKEQAFKGQLSRWPVQKIMGVLAKINQLEADLKKTGTSEELLLTRSVFGLSRMAA